MVVDISAKPVISWTMSECIAEHAKSRMLADSFRSRVSVKGKLAKMSARLGKDREDTQKLDMMKIKRRKLIGKRGTVSEAVLQYRYMYSEK